MELTAVQHDELIELLNIRFGRAAASLSELTGHRVLLEVTYVSIHPIQDLSTALRSVVNDNVATVHQISSFQFPVSSFQLPVRRPSHCVERYNAAWLTTLRSL